MKNLAHSTVFFLIMNVMIAVIMAVSGFNFTFPNQEMPEVHGYYIWYGVLEFIVVLGTLLFAEHIWNKHD
jgi:hypothetical protein